MRASESTKERILGEKRWGTRGRTTPHYEYDTEGIVSNAKSPARTKRERNHTYQSKEDDPWGQNESSEKRRDEAKGCIRFWAEGMG